MFFLFTHKTRDEQLLIRYISLTSRTQISADAVALHSLFFSVKAPQALFSFFLFMTEMICTELFVQLHHCCYPKQTR